MDVLEHAHWRKPSWRIYFVFFCVFIFVYVHLLTSYFIYLYIRQDIVVHCLRMNIFQHKYNFRNREYYIINETGNIKRSVNQVTP